MVSIYRIQDPSQEPLVSLIEGFTFYSAECSSKNFITLTLRKIPRSHGMFVAYGVNEDGSLQHVRVNLGPHLHRKYPIPCEEGLVLLLVSHAPEQTPPTDPDLKVFRVRLVEVVRATGGTGWTAVDLTQKPVIVVGKPEELDLDWDTSLETGKTLLITNEGFDCSTIKKESVGPWHWRAPGNLQYADWV